MRHSELIKNLRPIHITLIKESCKDWWNTPTREGETPLTNLFNTYEEFENDFIASVISGRHRDMDSNKSFLSYVMG
jgi:hypothetical protein